jgi:serine/threonine-protein kinase
VNDLAANPERRATTYRLFAQALDLPVPERLPFLLAQCADDLGLRAEVEALLAIASEGDGGLGTGALVGATAAAEESLAGRVFGRFRLRESIGEGGMGVVYLAERTDGVQQLVAVKLVSSLLAASAQQRFEREVQILARLEHPSVARLIDAGVEEGRAWVAIEYIRGARIDDYCVAQNLGIPAIVKLLVQLCAAVSAAHAMLVVHSDIKPANVLVTSDGLPKLIDFGIATALRETDGERAPTVDVGRLFSPNYSAAEQVTGGAVTVATDVFGLGALAYRLLTGVPIYREAKTAVAYLMAVSSEDVERPSRAALAGKRDLAWIKGLRGDLDAILGKALERSPERRYASATDFQADLQRYLDRRPVQARVPSLPYRTAKFVRRNARSVALAGLGVLAAAAGGIAAWSQSRATALANDMAARRGEFLEAVLKSANPRDGKRDITVAEVLDVAAQGLDAKLGAEPLVEASMLGVIADTNMELGRYPEALSARDRELKLLREHSGSERQIAESLSARGDLLSRAGNYPEAESTLRAAIASLTRLGGEEPLIATALGELGGVYTNTNREKDAEAAFSEAVRRDTRRTGFPQHQLAVLFGNQGRYEESATMAKEALDLQRAYFPADNPTLLTAVGTYAMTLSNLHRPAQADPLFRELVASSTRVRGPDHPDTLVAEVQLGDNLSDLGRFAEAAATIRAAAEALDRVVGANHRYALSAWGSYAMAACHTDQAAAGLAAAQHVLDMRSKLMQPGDWHIASARGEVGLCLSSLGRYAEAEPVLLQATAALESARGPGFFHTQKAYASLRDLYAATGRSAEAAGIAAKIQP